MCCSEQKKSAAAYCNLRNVPPPTSISCYNLQYTTKGLRRVRLARQLVYYCLKVCNTLVSCHRSGGWTKSHWRKFLSEFLRFPLANHHSTVPPYVLSPPPEVYDSLDHAAHYHIFETEFLYRVSRKRIYMN